MVAMSQPSYEIVNSGIDSAMSLRLLRLLPPTRTMSQPSSEVAAWRGGAATANEILSGSLAGAVGDAGLRFDDISTTMV
jgi:hypothetical protein